MRISDWSSDVCSSDLECCRRRGGGDDRPARSPVGEPAERPLQEQCSKQRSCHEAGDARRSESGIDRKSVGEGKSVLVGVEHGGRRINKKKIINNRITYT